MNIKSFLIVAGIVFLFAFLLHFIRGVLGLPLVYGDYVIPIWFSWGLAVISGVMSFLSFKIGLSK